ncbi:flagellar hook-basal body protein [Oscillospiraceae bacterium MB08-C2-2]|nr:flagellar hook-basal body protein [Oscillospiraceae bacterium MB08-C2-2]
MVRGFYTAASGLLTQQKRLNTYSDNIANVGTAGYKKDNLVTGTFGEHLMNRMNSYSTSTLHPIGPSVYGQNVADSYTDYTQGSLESTGRHLDAAISGAGFFVVNVGDEERLTRNGQFTLDEEGYLALQGLGRVQGESGDIQLTSGEITISRDGTVFLPPEEEGDDYTEVGRLRLVLPVDYDAMRKTTDGTYISPEFAQLEEGYPTDILQFSREKSNVDLGEEMTRLISSQRSLQSASQIVKMYDQLNEKTNSQIGRV